jgi:hypothetical protein
MEQKLEEMLFGGDAGPAPQAGAGAGAAARTEASTAEVGAKNYNAFKELYDVKY